MGYLPYVVDWSMLGQWGIVSSNFNFCQIVNLIEDVLIAKSHTPHKRLMNSAFICLARHGATDWNKLGILQGRTDVSINDLGRHQAHEMALAYAHAGFDAVWSSPLIAGIGDGTDHGSELETTATQATRGTQGKGFS
jgi:hypothetical protein